MTIESLENRPQAEGSPAAEQVESAPRDGATFISDREPLPRDERPRDSAVPAAELPLIPNYELLAVLGQGGMGVVYKARHLELNRLVALKMIRAPIGADAEQRMRFRLESEALAQLQHPNVVQVFELGEHHGRPFLALEFVSGGSLAERIAGRQQPVGEAVQLVESLARGMHAAHCRGIIHRDLKPANVLLAEDGTPKIADFGLARHLDRQSETQTGVIAGTARYMAPEQVWGGSQFGGVGPAADVYALGVVLYEMLSGQTPFQGESTLSTLEMVWSKEPPPLRSLRPDVPRDVETICHHCLRKDPKARYATAEALAEDLRRYRQHLPIQARPIRAWERAWLWCRRHPAAAALSLMLSLAAVLALVAFGAYRLEQFDRQAAELQRDYQEAEAHFQAARAAARRGQWREAVDDLDAALAGGHADPVAVRLARADAWSALNDTSRLRAEIEAIANLPDLGPHRSELLLWQAELAFFRGEAEQALALVQTAQQAGLPPGDAAYARGLVAADADSAVAELRAAHAIDPFKYRTLLLLCVELIMQGRHGEARQVALTGGALFPDDANLPVLLGVVEALEGNLADAQRRLNAVAARLNAPTVDSFRAAYQVLYDLRLGLHDPTAAQLDPAKIVRAATGVLGDLCAASELQLRLPARFRHLRNQLLQLMTTSVFGQHALAKGLEEAGQAIPDGIFPLTQGALLRANDLQAAERAFTRAAEMNSIFPEARRAALLYAAMAGFQLGTFASQDNDQHQQHLRRALGYARRYVEQGQFDSSQTAAIITAIAWQAAEYDIARQFVLRSLESYPQDITLLFLAARIEFDAGSYVRSADLCAEVLRRHPDHSAARFIREQALLRTKEWLERHEPIDAP